MPKHMLHGSNVVANWFVMKVKESKTLQAQGGQRAHKPAAILILPNHDLALHMN